MQPGSGSNVHSNVISYRVVQYSNRKKFVCFEQDNLRGQLQLAYSFNPSNCFHRECKYHTQGTLGSTSLHNWRSGELKLQQKKLFFIE